jgi:hypothetical protein
VNLIGSKPFPWCNWRSLKWSFNQNPVVETSRPVLVSCEPLSISKSQPKSHCSVVRQSHMHVFSEYEKLLPFHGQTICSLLNRTLGMDLEFIEGEGREKMNSGLRSWSIPPLERQRIRKSFCFFKISDVLLYVHTLDGDCGACRKSLEVERWKDFQERDEFITIVLPLPLHSPLNDFFIFSMKGLWVS